MGTIRVVAFLLALAATAAGRDCDETARAVRDAHAEGDHGRLASLAARDGVDPWLVADEVVARGAVEAAKAYAAAVPDQRTRDALARYLASEAARPTRGLRETLRVAHEQRMRNNPKATLVALALVEPAASVVGVRMLHERAAALRDLGREEEGLRTDVAAARLAHAIGWQRQRNVLLRRLCTRHFNAEAYWNDASGLPRRSRDLDEHTAELSYGWIADQLIAAVGTRAGVDYVPLESRIDGADRVLAYSAASSTSLIDELRRRFFDPLDLDDAVRSFRVAPPPKFRMLPFAALAPDRVIVYQTGASREWDSDEAVGVGRGVVAVCDAEGERRDEVQAAGTLVLGPGTDASRVEQALVSAVPWRAVHFACAYRVDDQAFVLGDGARGEIGRASLHGAFAAELLVFSGDGAHRIWQFRSGPRDTPGEWLPRLAWRLQGVLQLGEKVPRVLVPCWQPDADATRALMLRFYALWNPGDGEEGIPAAEALQRAQAHVRAQERWRHPYYWAGWQLWGRSD